MPTMSSETLGKTSSRTSDSMASSIPQKPERARAGTLRGNLELDQPLNRIKAAMTPARNIRRLYAPTNRTGVQRKFWMHTIIGFVMIGTLFFGSLFGVIFAIIKTHGALGAGGTPDFNSSGDELFRSSSFVTSTLVPYSFSTLVLSHYSTLVPTQVTIYVQSEASTLVNSAATTLVESLFTLSQRDTATSAQVASISPSSLVKEERDVTSTISLTKSVTTTVTIAVYNTTSSNNPQQSVTSSGGGSEQSCGNGACKLTAKITADTQSNSVTSTLSALTEVSSLITTSASDIGVSKASSTDSISVACLMTEISGKLICSALPTGWSISPSPPRATSILHPVFRLISSSLFRIKPKSAGRSIHLVLATAWKQCCSKVLVNFCGGGNVLDRLISPLHVGQPVKDGGIPPPLITRRQE